MTVKIKAVRTNDITLEVTPISAGNYGCFSISGVTRTPADELRLANNIKNEIEHHVSDVGNVYVNQKRLYTIDGSEEKFDSLYDMLDDKYNESWSGYIYEYKNVNESIGTRCYSDSFKEVIERAFNYPEHFEMKSDITEEQRKFLNNVLSEAKNYELVFE